MRPSAWKLFALSVAAAMAALPAFAETMKITVYQSEDPKLFLQKVKWEKGNARQFTAGIGSGAFRHPKDPANRFYTVGDRGPNFTCAAVKKVTGLDAKSICQGRKVRVYPLPDYTPSIYQIELGTDANFAVTQIIPLKDQAGKPISGLTNPLTVAKTEKAVDFMGRPLNQDPSAVDAEGIIKLTDGTFWIGEENAPSILHVAADGRILRRIVPEGTGKDFAKANYKVEEGLPAILAKRQTNRGIESMAVSPDEKFLYFMLQNPLANPNKAAYAKAKNTRVFKMDRASMKVIGQYVYQLDDPQTFRNDPSKKQNAPRVSEVHALGGNRLLVLERTNKTTKLHEVSLKGATNILGTKWDDLKTKPSLEQSNDLSKTGISAVQKSLRWDSANHKAAPTKIEGIAFMGNGSLMLVNDNDFGITGAKTKILVINNHGIAVE